LFVIPQRSGGICFSGFPLRCILCRMVHAKQRVSLCLSLFAVVLVIGCRGKKPTLGSGDEWRSWKPIQRAAFVEGFVDGQSFGSAETCSSVDDSFTEGTKLPPGALMPSAVCIAARKTYTRGHLISSSATLKGATFDVSEYTSVLDIFYEHPECRVMPYNVLLEHLNDKEYRSGEDLFKLVHSEHPGGWGFFTGFDGMDKCLPNPPASDKP
jgi:hypothetical protein